jgi:DNA-binding NarL/FixJ family response regulator
MGGAEAPRDRSPRAVVVDDDDAWRDIVTTALRRFGFDVVGHAADGATAVEVLREAQPDVALIDVRMHGMNGLEVLTAVRHDVPDTRIVMCSAEDDHRPAAMQAGADAWYTKSDGLRALVSVLSGDG